MEFGTAAGTAEETNALNAAMPANGTDATVTVLSGQRPDEGTWVQEALVAVDEAVYEWVVSSDELKWSENAVSALGFSDISTVLTGRQFGSLLDPDNFTNRYETVINSSQVDEGEGVAFQLQYRMFPRGREDGTAVWVEDTGRWFGGLDGQPDRVIGVLRNVNDRLVREQELNYLSTYDALTGLMNRARLAEALSETITSSEQYRIPCAFMLAGIDNLAMINDAYGFDVADKVIAAVSERLRAAMRTGDSIGRYAGNKFGLILSNCSEQDMEVAARRLLRSVRDQVIDTGAGPVSATISVGGLCLPKHARNSHEAMVRAEEALNSAKLKHRDSFIIYKHSQKRESLRKRNLMFADEIVSALNNRRLTIAYQPIVSTKNEEPALYECLLRLVKPDNEVVSAGNFIPIAEQLGLVRLIDHRVLELAMNTLDESENAQLSLNISGLTASDPRWFANLTAFISAHRECAERLTVEITETVALEDIAESGRFIASLRDLGCKVAIDDFGAGYTSFRNLKMMEVDMVKLDGSFCHQLCENKDNQFFVRTLIELAKNFDLEVVAEHVEEQQDAELLKELGVDYLQGYLYGAASMEKPWLNAEEQSAQQFIAL